MWAQIEADFWRDYGIRLARELDHMSWRCFKMLLMGLSANGAFFRDYERVREREQALDRQAGQEGAQAESAFIAFLKGC